MQTIDLTSQRKLESMAYRFYWSYITDWESEAEAIRQAAHVSGISVQRMLRIVEKKQRVTVVTL